MVVNIESFVDYNITTIQEIFLATAWEEKQETVEEQNLISRTLESWVGEEMHACGANQQSLWVIFDTISIQILKDKECLWNGIITKMKGRVMI